MMLNFRVFIKWGITIVIWVKQSVICRDLAINVEKRNVSYFYLFNFTEQ